MSITAKSFNHVGLDGLLMMEWGINFSFAVITGGRKCDMQRYITMKAGRGHGAKSYNFRSRQPMATGADIESVVNEFQSKVPFSCSVLDAEAV